MYVCMYVCTYINIFMCVCARARLARARECVAARPGLTLYPSYL